MNSDSSATYLEERILSANPLELIQILYDAAVDRVRSARLHLSTGDAMSRAQDVSKALEIFTELALALNDRDAQASASTYSAIYRHLQKRLVEAHTQKSDAVFKEIEDMVVSMSKNWRSVRDLLQGAREAEQTGVKPAADASSIEMLYTPEATVERLDAEAARSGRCWNL